MDTDADRAAELARTADLIRFLAAYPEAVAAFLAAQPDLGALREQLATAIEVSGSLDF
jgi:hypothetical protein